MEEEIKKEEKKDDEIITWKELKERHQEVPLENLHKLILICKNCGHKDLLIKFLKKDEPRRIMPAPDYPENWKPKPWKGDPPYPSPYRDPKPKPWKRPYYYTKTQNKDKIVMITEAGMLFNIAISEEYFFCPKCGSSIVALSSEFSKNNLVKVL